MIDNTGRPIPEAIEANWKRADKTGREIVTFLNGLIKMLEQGKRDNDIRFVEIPVSTINTARDARSDLRRIIPYAVCPSCNGGEERHTCQWCRRRGYMSRFHYENCIPAAMRERIDDPVMV